MSSLKRNKGLKRSRLRRVSRKRAIELKAYSKLRADYLAEHTHCEVTLPDELPCWKRSTEIHHRKRRSGKMLLNRRYFLSCCSGCHRHIEDHKNWAREKGYILYR